MIQDALLQTVRDLPIEGRALLSILMRVGTSPAANIKQQ
jgi:hypothetical protein